MTGEQEEQFAALRALSSLANGNWDKAHELVQDSLDFWGFRQL